MTVTIHVLQNLFTTPIIVCEVYQKTVLGYSKQMESVRSMLYTESMHVILSGTV